MIVIITRQTSLMEFGFSQTLIPGKRVYLEPSTAAAFIEAGYATIMDDAFESAAIELSEEWKR